MGRRGRDRRPGFLNIRLKPAAKQQVVREVLAAGAASAASPPTASACWWSSSPPIPPARCTSATAARRRWATPCATCTPRRAGTSGASSITTTPACRSHAGHQRAAARQGLQAGRSAEMARGGLQRRLHPGHRRRLPGEEDGQVGRPRVHRQRRRRRPGRHPPVRRGLPAPRAGPGPAGLRRALRQLLPRVQPLHQRQGRRGRCSA
jgi:hypothetical protein